MRYRPKELELLKKLVARHGKDGFTWLDVGNAFRKRYPNRPMNGVLDKAREIKQRSKPPQPDPEYVTVKLADLVRVRDSVRAFEQVLTELIRGSEPT